MFFLEPHLYMTWTEATIYSQITEKQQIFFLKKKKGKKLNVTIFSIQLQKLLQASRVSL